MTARIRQADLARLLGVSRATVSRAVRAGLIEPGPDGRFDPDEAVRQYHERARPRVDQGPGQSAAGPAPDRARYVAARADVTEHEAKIKALQLAELRGDLVRLADVRREYGALLVELRTSLLALPPRLAPILAPESDAARIDQILRDEIADVLRRSSR